MKPAYRWCIAAFADATALERLLEDGDVGGYYDPEPWHIAADLLTDAGERGETLFMLLVTGNPPEISRWAEVTEIEVHAHASNRTTHVRFGASGAMNPIFSSLDAVTLRPPEHTLEREEREGLRVRRLHLDPSWLHSYAICETPGCLPPADPVAGEPDPADSAPLAGT